MPTKLLPKSLVLIGGVIGALSASAVQTQANLPKFYVGLGLDYNFYSLNPDFKHYINNNHSEWIKTNGWGIAVPLLGFKFHENFAVELGSSFNKKIEYCTGITIKKIKANNIFVDLTSFIPLEPKLKFIMGAGIGRVQLKYPSDSYVDCFTNPLNWRFKFGWQYALQHNLSLRVLGSYQRINNTIQHTPYGENDYGKFDVKSFKNMKTIGASIIYQL